MVLGDTVFKKLLQECEIHIVQSSPFVPGILIIVKSMSVSKGTKKPLPVEQLMDYNFPPHIGKLQKLCPAINLKARNTVFRTKTDRNQLIYKISPKT